MKRVKKAVIPAGGYGTRFLPASKSIPKEMFPLGNKPIILHVVEEAVAAGIEQIIFVVSHHKQTVESFFGSNKPLEDYYIAKEKLDEVGELHHIEQMADYAFVYAHPPYGNGGALLPARPFLDDEPFVVAWADELVLTPPSAPSRIQACVDAFHEYQKPVVAMMEITDAEKRHRYGMAKYKDIQGSHLVKEIETIVEKPAMGEEPSSFAAHSAYVLTSHIFKAFDETFLGKDGELWLSDLINSMKEHTGLLGVMIEGANYLDCGNPDDYLFSQVTLAMRDNPECSKRLFDLINRKNT